MLTDILDGKGPIYMRTDEALANLAAGDAKKLRELESEAWEDFLDMTISQALLWSAQNIAPEEKASELQLAEPYIMGSHSGCAGMWVSGPGDLGGPAEWSWGYNRMTTVKGLFTAGDGVGAAPHKFSSGSFAEGRLAAKAAVAFIRDNPGNVGPDEGKVNALKAEIYQPLATYEENKGKSTVPEVNPNFITAKQGLTRLQKIMDEYAAGASTWYKTNEPMLNRALELLAIFKEDMAKLGATNLHDLMRCWELQHRAWTAEAHVRHMLARKETRWPGYYYRTDYPQLDDANWRVFVNSRYDPATGEWKTSQKPYVQLVSD
jgi:adenylylsulfate reductase subunit A